MKHYIIGLLTLGVVALGSCDKQEIPQPDAPELVVAQTETLSLPSSPIDHRIAVNTNLSADKWTVLSRESWLRAQADGQNIHLLATENLTTTARKAIVQVSGGGLMKSFEVVQAATSTKLDIGFAPEAIDQWGGKLSIDVVSNMDNWTASTQADWITLKPNHRDGLLSIEVSEHKGRNERRATIEVQDTQAGITKTFEVVQKGIIYFMLPCMDYELSGEDLITYERTRRSKLIKGPSYSIPTYQFTTVSPAFNQIDYEINYMGDRKVSRIKMYLANPNILDGAEKTSFFDFLKQKGFEELHEEIYYSDKNGTEIELKLGEAKPYVLCTYFPTQERHDPAISKLPLDVSEFGKTTPEEVDAWQKDNGGEVDAQRTIGNSVKVYQSHELIGPKQVKINHTHVYRFRFNKLNSTEHTDPVLFRYLYLAGNKIFLTREFRALLYRSGYVYHSSNLRGNIRFTYRNPQTKVELAMRVLKDPYVADPKTASSVVEMKFKQYN